MYGIIREIWLWRVLEYNNGIIVLCAENMIATMLTNSQNWNAVHETVRNIMRQKETDITAQ